MTRSLLCVVASVAMLVASYFVIVRSCAHDHGTVLGYGLYSALYVLLPGCILLTATQRRRPSVLEIFALGLPLGFAAEIGLFFAASVVNARALLPFSPLLWMAVGLIKFPQVRASLTGRRDHGPGFGTPAAVCAVACLVGAVVFTVVSQLYAGAPFADGVLAKSTHHDWVYLLSRAAEIKQRWPLQDPSMAGQPLSYHYFLLVHLASASLVTGIKLEMLGLRLFVLPLSAALIGQSLLLGRLMTRSIWGGVLAAVLVMAANELSLGERTVGSAFGNLFLSWLFISPTFFFGMVYSGALILWIYRLLASERVTVSEWLVLALLAMIGTGAKGTVVPPLLLALGLWFVVEVFHTRRFPKKTSLMLLALGTGFAAVYFTVLADWGTGAASFAPLASMKLSSFWQNHVEPWEQTLRGFGIGAGAAHGTATVVGLLVALIGYSGVRLFSVIAVCRWRVQPNPTLTCWLGASALSYFLFGYLLVLDSNSQLYLLFPVRLPQAVLSAAVLLCMAGRVRRRLGEFGKLGSVYGRGVALLFLAGTVCAFVLSGSISWWWGLLVLNVAAFLAAPSQPSDLRVEKSTFAKYLWTALPLVLVAALMVVQVNDWRRINLQGFKLWLSQPTVTADPSVTLLRGAMDWVRENTPADAVLVANAFSDRNLRAGAVAALDNTTVDKYYYYSALAERRLWVEGPTYLRSQTEASRRVTAASRVFYSGAPTWTLFNDKNARPSYALIDHALNDGATIHLSPDACVFRNDRISVYRLSGDVLPSKRGLASVTE